MAWYVYIYIYIYWNALFYIMSLYIIYYKYYTIYIHKKCQNVSISEFLLIYTFSFMFGFLQLHFCVNYLRKSLILNFSKMKGLIKGLWEKKDMTTEKFRQTPLLPNPPPPVPLLLRRACELFFFTFPFYIWFLYSWYSLSSPSFKQIVN